MDNFETVLKIALDAKVPKVISYVYISVIDKGTFLTNLDDVQKMYDIIGKLTKDIE